MESEDIKNPGEWQGASQTYQEGDHVAYDGQEWVCKYKNNLKKKPRIKTILFWVFNGFFASGLLTFTVIHMLRGDTFHAVTDILYLLIILECLFLLHKHKKLQQEYDILLEGSKVLIKQNADMTETIRSINDPFRNDRSITINTSHVRMEKITSSIKYNKSFVIECSNKEREKRYQFIERDARKNLMNELIDTELITVKHYTDEDNIRRCAAEIIVGVKVDKDIEEIIHPHNEI